MKKNQHIHRFERVITKKGNVIYRCNLPDCVYYVSEFLAKGKRCICNRCGLPMILDTRAMKLVKPHCADCINFKKKVENHDVIAEFLEANDVLRSS